MVFICSSLAEFVGTSHIFQLQLVFFYLLDNSGIMIKCHYM